MLNSAADITIENCSGDYNDEIEPDANATLHKGVHGGSGGPGASTGIEDDLVNVIGTCFYDLFTSDTTGFVGLVFNDKGQKHAADVTITAGTPFFNGLGDLVMNTIGDQIVYEFPYWIRGHTGFANTTPSKIGVNPTNIGAEYALDTGSGYGSWKDATGANLSGETISPAGFKIKFRFTTSTGTSQNLRGFAIYTTTTISDQKSNLYPLNVITLTVSDLVPGSDVVIYDSSTDAILDSVDSNSTTSWDYVYETTTNVDIGIFKAGYIPLYIRNYPLSSSDATLPVSLVVDRAYLE